MFRLQEGLHQLMQIFDPFQLAGTVFGGAFRVEYCMVLSRPYCAIYLGTYIGDRRAGLMEQQKVVLKIFNRDIWHNPISEARFIREIEVASELPPDAHLVPLYSYGTHGTRRNFPWFAMRWSPRGNISSMINPSDPMPLELVWRYAYCTSSALIAIHAAGFIHRDLKPENLLHHPGDLTRCDVADLGIARFSGSSNLTREHSLVGTPHFMSPEQILSKPLSGRSDLYSLSCVLYALLTGHPVFPVPITQPESAVFTRYLNESPVDIRDLRSDISRNFANIIMRNLNHDPEERFRDAVEFREALNLSPEGTWR